MRKTLFLSVVIMALGITSAWAATSCYTMAEAEAEQGIRIHSELMVIGLNCQHLARGDGGKNLYQQYSEFTAQNVNLFAGYESRLMDYFHRAGYADPEAKLNELRTVLANTISLDAAKMRPDLFCYKYAPRISTAAKMNQTAIQRWAATFYPSHPVSRPICEQ